MLKDGSGGSVDHQGSGGSCSQRSGGYAVKGFLLGCLLLLFSWQDLVLFRLGVGLVFDLSYWLFGLILGLTWLVFPP